MASPLRFRISNEHWDDERFGREVLRPLDDKFGATAELTHPNDEFEGRLLRMGNGDVALFAWSPDPTKPAYWTGNTETPKSLWRTEKRAFEDVGGALADWAQDRLLGILYDEAPWLSRYEALAWFFLPVLMSKDGAETARDFLRTGAGFPTGEIDADRALSFYADVVSSGLFDGHRYEMASKLGSSESRDGVRMSATMGEFNSAKILHDAGYELVPEPEVETGHRLDYLARRNGHETLVEVTRPSATENRSAGTPEAAVRETASKKSKGDGQLNENDGLLLVDCSSFDDKGWRRIAREKPDAGHEPAVFYRVRPDEPVEAYLVGETRVRLSEAVEWV